MYSVFETVISCAYRYCLIVTYLKKIDKDLSISTGLIAVTVSFNPLRGKIPKHFTSDDIIPSSLPFSLSSFLSFSILFTQYTPHPTTPPSTSKSNSLHPYPPAHLPIPYLPSKSPFTKKRTYRPSIDRPLFLSFFFSFSLFLSKIKKKKKKKKEKSTSRLYISESRYFL